MHTAITDRRLRHEATAAPGLVPVTEDARSPRAARPPLGTARLYTSPRDRFSGPSIDVEAAEHYRNLTRGLLCGPAGSKVLRIQSTHCEQQHWEQLLWQIPDQLLWDLARGRTVIVHDRSERSRETRAMWQGLPLVKLVTETAWFGQPVGDYHFERGGMSSWQHLNAVAAALPRPVRKRFAYFRQHRMPELAEAHLYSCYRLDLHAAPDAGAAGADRAPTAGQRHLPH